MRWLKGEARTLEAQVHLAIARLSRAYVQGSATTIFSVGCFNKLDILD